MGKIVFGFATGWCLAVLLLYATKDYARLDSCEKAHNVYQCEMVAVPKTGEN